jgi:hypothetical protein
VQPGARQGFDLGLEIRELLPEPRPVVDEVSRAG